MDAYRQILRFITEREMKPGELLPPQAALGKMLKTCQATLQSAMELLVEDGVLERRRKLGTIVRVPSPNVLKREIWRAGLVMPPLEGSLFFPLLTTRLHRSLSFQSVLDRTYFLSPLALEPATGNTRQPTEFTGLASDIESDLLDIIITPTRLTTNKLPVIHVGSIWHADDIGVYFDEGYLLEDSVASMIERSRKDILCVIHHPLTDEGSGLGAAYSRLLKKCAAQGMSLDLVQIPNDENAGPALSRYIAGRPSRPDGIVISNDVVAMQFCEALLNTNYRPAIVTPTNLQTFLSFALPVIRMAFDIEDLSGQAVQMALRHLRQPSLKGAQIFIRHSRID